MLYGTYARGVDLAPPAARETMLSIVDQHWGLGSRVLADLFLPDATADERAEFAELQRRSASREVALASLRAVYDFDSTGHLGDVLAPTLVLHRRDDRAIPFALGEELAGRIRNARFVALEGDDHFPWRGDADAVVREALAFLGAPVERVAASATSGAAGTSARRAPPRASPNASARCCVSSRAARPMPIAAHLVLSTHTVHRHIANIRTKLGVPSRTAAAAWALRDELI